MAELIQTLNQITWPGAVVLSTMMIVFGWIMVTLWREM